jgi:hypothetical protein
MGPNSTCKKQKSRDDERPDIFEETHNGPKVVLYVARFNGNLKNRINFVLSQ